MVVISISQGGTPRGVAIDGGTAEVEDSHEVEGEDTGRSRSRAIIGDAAGTADIVKVLDLSFSIHFCHCMCRDSNFMLIITQNQCQSRLQTQTQTQ